MNCTIKLQTFVHRIGWRKVKTTTIQEIGVLCCVYTKFWSFNWFNVICVLSIAQNPVPNIQSAALMEITFRKIDPTFVCYAIFGSNKTERVRPLNFKLRRVMISNG